MNAAGATGSEGPTVVTVKAEHRMNWSADRASRSRKKSTM